VQIRIQIKNLLLVNSFFLLSPICEPSLHPASLADLSVEALEFYLHHTGFGVQATSIEISMARHFIVDGLSYTSAEKRFGVCDKKGFAAMYSVCKLGGFKGLEDICSMTSEAFDQRLLDLHISA
jgi:hypothetical protein